MAEDLVAKLKTSLDSRPPRTFATGFRWLDVVTNGGLRSGDVSVVTAFSGYGKTAFMEQIALHVSLSHPVQLQPLEMGEDKTMRRLAAKIARCSETAFLRTYRGEIDILTAAALQERQLSVREPKPRRPRVDVRRIAEMIRTDVVGHKPRPVIMIDHTREIAGWLSDAKQGHVGPTQICQAFEDLAVELDVHIMLAAQLSADSKGKRPDLWKTQDTAALEQIASLWIKLHRPFSGSQRDDVAMLIVAKNRYGPPNVSHPFRWVGESQLMYEYDDQALAEVERRLHPGKKESVA